MSEQYSDELRFALFVNDKKGNEKAPDVKGSITVNGQKYWLSAWKRESASGKKYMSGQAQLAEAPPQPAAPAPAPKPAPKAAPTPVDQLDDDLPF